MMTRRLALGGAALIAVCGVLVGRCVAAGPSEQPVIRIAEIEIDPTQVMAYTTALKTEIAQSIRVEPGVLRLYAVSVKGHPEQVRLFEMYASQAAYESHLQTPHFKQYKAATQGMVKSLRLVETEPVMLGSK